MLKKYAGRVWTALICLRIQTNIKLTWTRQLTFWFTPGISWISTAAGPIYSTWTLLLLYTLKQLSPSWEAINCAATQELPSILWNPKVHYRVHKSPALVSILNEIDPIHTIPSY
jgi:hypothetical protein